MECHWCKSLLLQLSGEVIPHYGEHLFCSVEHRAYYRAGLRFNVEGLQHVEAHHDAKT